MLWGGGGVLWYPTYIFTEPRSSKASEQGVYRVPSTRLVLSWITKAPQDSKVVKGASGLTYLQGQTFCCSSSPRLLLPGKRALWIPSPPHQLLPAPKNVFPDAVVSALLGPFHSGDNIPARQAGRQTERKNRRFAAGVAGRQADMSASAGSPPLSRPLWRLGGSCCSVAVAKGNKLRCDRPPPAREKSYFSGRDRKKRAPPLPCRCLLGCLCPPLPTSDETSRP